MKNIYIMLKHFASCIAIDSTCLHFGHKKHDFLFCYVDSLDKINMQITNNCNISINICPFATLGQCIELRIPYELIKEIRLKNNEEESWVNAKILWKEEKKIKAISFVFYTFKLRFFDVFLILCNLYDF